MGVKKFNEFNKIEEKKSETATKVEGWILTVVTKEAIDKALKSKTMTSVFDMGKHFKAKDKAELAELEAKYKEGEKCNGETIARVFVQKADEKFESYF